MNNTTKTTARCARCGRALTSARALRTGYGPRCYTMVRAAAREVAAQHKPHQIAKATELIEDGGVVPTTRTGVYYTVGTKGEIYKTARTGCTCPAGLNRPLRLLPPHRRRDRRGHLPAGRLPTDPHPDRARPRRLTPSQTQTRPRPARRRAA